MTNSHKSLFSTLTRRATLVAIVVCSTLAGCNKGPRLYDVKGVVNVDGKPTEGISFLFFKKGEKVASASGKSGAGGTISTSTNGETGIELGQYDLTAIYHDPKYVAPPPQFGQTPPDPPDLFKGKYFSSKVSVDIASPDTPFTVDLTLK